MRFFLRFRRGRVVRAMRFRIDVGSGTLATPACE